MTASPRPYPRKPNPRVTPPLRERLMAHSDDERDMARARLRAAHANYTRAAAIWWPAIEERQQAAAHALDVGVTVAEIAGMYGYGPLTTSPVTRMIARTRGADPNAKMKRDQKKAREALRLDRLATGP